MYVSERQKVRRKATRGPRSMREILNYATQNYGLKFPKDFAEYLYEISFEKWVPSEAVIGALYRQWRVWEPYVSSDSFNEFMIDSIKAICKFHATTTISLPFYETYIGKKAKVVKPLPAVLITSVNQAGRLVIN